jgi:hypothetical protein
MLDHVGRGKPGTFVCDQHFLRLMVGNSFRAGGPDGRLVRPAR